MSAKRPPGDRPPLSVANRIDVICDRFESVWKTGERPTIGDFLAETPPGYATHLFAELVRIDLEYRAFAGEVPSIDEYASVYPQFSEVLTGIRRELQVAETISLPTRPVEKIGRYELLLEIGGGGFGTVWKAKDTVLNRMVAVKRPHARLDQAEAFLREARAASALEHPNIVPVLDSGVADGVPYIVFRFVEGITLRDAMQIRTLTPRDAAELIVPVCQALDHARTRGVVHRDLKPSNILLDADGRPHVADFGLASRRLESMTIAPEPGLAGTPAYMSPEQVLGRDKLDHRTDVYSLGATLYELLTGAAPFQGDQTTILYQIAHVDPESPRARNPDVPRDLETICLKAMAKVRDDRYQTAGEMADDLRRFLDGQPIEARPVSRGERAWRWIRRNRALSAALGVALCAMLAAVALAVQPPPVVDESPERLIAFNTEPAGARVVFWRLDDRTGEETGDPNDRIEAPTRSPVRMRLAPGNYLVVAALDAKRGDAVRFQEVYRHVPSHDEKLPVAGIDFWEHDDDDSSVIRLPGAAIPQAEIVNGMAFMTGRDDFRMGVAGAADMPEHVRAVRDFYIGPTEVTVAELVAANRESFLFLGGKNFPKPPPDHAVCLPFSYAAVLAEKLGKRLPTEAEYEYAATNGGTTKYPWGNNPPTAEQISTDGILPVGQPTFDVLPLKIPVKGLCSNVAEWTMSRASPYPPLLGASFQMTADAERQRVVRGPFQSKSSVARHVDDYDPRTRRFVVRYTMNPGLGLRCVRSAQPRIGID